MPTEADRVRRMISIQSVTKLRRGGRLGRLRPWQAQEKSQVMKGDAFDSGTSTTGNRGRLSAIFPIGL